MSTIESVTSITLLANADLSASQYHFVKVGAGTYPLSVAAAGESAIGVLMNKPGEATGAAGESAQVAILGCPKVKLGGTIAVGDNLAADADGAAIVATTPAFVVAKALQAGTDGQVVRVLLMSQFTIPA